MIFGLSRIVNRGKLDVRMLALNNMFEIMRLYGRHFTESVREIRCRDGAGMGG